MASKKPRFKSFF